MAGNNYRRGPGDAKWKEVRNKVRDRDKFCRLMRKLKISETYELKNNASRKELSILDPAHVIPASAAPHMIYDEDNIVLLNRYSHEQLDYNRNPVNGKSITKDEVSLWWAKIVGLDKYQELLQRAKNKKKGGDDDE